jgi:uncharacterized damage-inducible protein DinB
MTQAELPITVAINSWKLVNGRLDEIIASMSDADLEGEIAPGRNRVFYLLGHLVAVHDRLFPMLGFGDRLYSDLDAEFLERADTHTESIVTAAALRSAWTRVNARLTAAFESAAPDHWLQKHSAVTDEDFQKDPHRNRLSVLLSRTNHVSFHTGQIRLTQ